jgi:hypothetical protein
VRSTRVTKLFKCLLPSVCALELAPPVSCRRQLLSVSSAAALTSVSSRRSSLVRPIVPAAEPNLVYNIKYYGAPPHLQGPSLSVWLHTGCNCLWLFLSVLPQALAQHVCLCCLHTCFKYQLGNLDRVQQPVDVVISVTCSSGGSVSSK